MGTTPEAMVEMGQFMEDARKAGIAAANGGLQPKSTRIRLSSGKVSVTDGPFIEGKGFIPGFAVIQMNTKEEALERATRLRKIVGDGESRIAQAFGSG
jgi:hypothetical protein